MAVVEIFDVENNLVVFGEKPQTDTESLKKRARLFYVGEHKGRKYSNGDLEKIAKNFKPDDGIPVQLDHSSSARDTVGKVRSVEYKDGELFGELEFLGKDAVDSVRLGKWDKVSVGLKIDDEAMSLQEVSVTPFPALKNAKVFSQEEPVKDKPKADDKTKTEETVKMSEFVAMQAEIRQMKEEKEKLEKTIRFKEDSEHIEKFCQEGKTTPAMRDVELKLYHSMSEEQRALFSKYKEAQPMLIDFKVYSKKEFSKPGAVSAADAEKEADELLKFSIFGKETK